MAEAEGTGRAGGRRGGGGGGYLFRRQDGGCECVALFILCVAEIVFTDLHTCTHELLGTQDPEIHQSRFRELDLRLFKRQISLTDGSTDINI